MALVLDGTGSITGLSAGGLPNGSVTADDLASTLDLTGKTVTLPAGTGGKVLQVVSAASTANLTTTSTSYVVTGLTLSITPSSSSSKVLLFANCNLNTQAQTTWVYITFFKNGSNLVTSGQDRMLGHYSSTVIDLHTSSTLSWIDSPATTSSITYDVRIRSGNGGSIRFNADQHAQNIIAMEIAA
jgi:hypothetical protein